MQRKSKEVFDIQQLMMLAVQREYSISSWATYEWLDYPKALFDASGFYKKSGKSMLIDDVEMRTSCSTSAFSTVLSSSNPTVHLFDGRVLVHLLRLSKYNTFGEFAKDFFNYIVSFFKNKNVYRICVLFDRYDQISTKL